MPIPHICELHMTKWSKAVEGYNGTAQFRTHKVCNSLHWRKVGYAEQIRAKVQNEAASEFNEDFKGE